MTEELNEIEEIDTEEVQKEVKTYDFPEGTVFYQELRESDGVKWLCGTTDNPSLADSLGFLDNHYNFSELTLKNGVFYLNGYVRPDKTEAELIAEKANQIDKELEALLDATVHQRNYKNVESCVSYFNSTDDKYRAEAIAVNRWRDDLYRTAQTVLDEVKAGRIDWHDVDVNYIVSRVDPLVW